MKTYEEFSFPSANGSDSEDNSETVMRNVLSWLDNSITEHRMKRSDI